MAGIERELKLEAGPGFDLPDLTEVADGLPVATLPPETLVATYYDTEDLVLLRSGITVRYRTGDDDPIWTVKLPAKGADSFLARREVECKGPESPVPAEVADLLLARLRHRPLEPVARVETARYEVEIRSGDGARLVVVSDDTVSVDGEPAFREIEVERQDDAPDALVAAVVDRVRSAGASDGDGRSKVARVLGDRAVSPPEPAPVPLGKKAAAGDVVRAAITDAVTRLLEHDVAVRLGGNAEAVHQARVATRRLRSDLKTLRPLVDEEWAKGVRAELKWLGNALGMVRDNDVLIERLREQAAQLPDVDRAGAEVLLRQLTEEGDVHRQALLEALRSPRYVELVDGLVRAASDPPLTDAAKARATAVLPDLVRRPWKRLRSAVRQLPRKPTDEQLHEIRIRTKQARYAAEASSGVVGKRARRLASALASLQSVLGELQDGAVAEDWLRAAAARNGAGVAAGELVAAQDRSRAKARKEWRRAWRSASKKKLRSWLS